MAEKCGAKTRAGGRCGQPGNPKNGRCRFHGGLSTGAKHYNAGQNAYKHGFYSDALQPDELELWNRAEIGSLDLEIRLMRVKLHRLVRMSGSADVAELIDSALEVAVEQGTDKRLGKFTKREIRVKAATYADLIIQAIETLRKLELARKDLNKDPEDPEEGPVHKILVEVVGANAPDDND